MNECLAFIEGLAFATFDAVHALADHVPPLSPGFQVAPHAAELDVFHAEADGNRIEIGLHDERELALAYVTLASDLHRRVSRRGHEESEIWRLLRAARIEAKVPHKSGMGAALGLLEDLLPRADRRLLKICSVDGAAHVHSCILGELLPKSVLIAMAEQVA